MEEMEAKPKTAIDPKQLALLTRAAAQFQLTVMPEFVELLSKQYLNHFWLPLHMPFFIQRHQNQRLRPKFSKMTKMKEELNRKFVFSVCETIYEKVDDWIRAMSQEEYDALPSSRKFPPDAE
uniref:Uncharacterized protein n=1 Tax=Octactis speculum TaxID=3111310 RepID=A0A7S2DZG7_9STRA|mmetsp:Transcript_5566/g.6916  ORF Transcript_5566/g.6916 Transcript_5566/m.6916 type:complete len:122 (+) Transcript_5566:312-677(+)